jgi:hypothetical protein
VPADADNCSGEYDDYKYGLSDLANQTTNLYITTYYADNASTPRYGSNPARAARCCMQWLEPGSRGAMPIASCGTRGMMPIVASYDRARYVGSCARRGGRRLPVP